MILTGYSRHWSNKGNVLPYGLNYRHCRLLGNSMLSLVNPKWTVLLILNIVRVSSAPNVILLALKKIKWSSMCKSIIDNLKLRNRWLERIWHRRPQAHIHHKITKKLPFHLKTKPQMTESNFLKIRIVINLKQRNARWAAVRWDLPEMRTWTIISHATSRVHLNALNVKKY